MLSREVVCVGLGQTMDRSLNIRTEVTPDELTQALRLNRTRMYWPKLLLANWYASLLLIALVCAETSRVIEGKPIQPSSLGLLLIPLALLWLYWYRSNAAIRTAATQMSDTQGSATIDPNGISASSSTGATSFIPWREYGGWKEGTDVFTLTTEKSFRVFSKRGLNDIDLEQLRSLFRSYIS
jgi:YcxB-like protein